MAVSPLVSVVQSLWLQNILSAGSRTPDSENVLLTVRTAVLTNRGENT